MPFPTIDTLSNAKRITAVVDAIYVRPSGELYQTLGAISNAEIVFEEYIQEDTRKRNKSIKSVRVTAKATMMQASLTELELMDTLCSGTNAFLFKMADAAAIPTAGSAVTVGWFLLSSAQVGVKPKDVLSGSVEENARIELEFQGSLQHSAFDAAIKAAIDDDEFEATGGSGTLKAIGTYTAAKNGGLPTEANIKSCGVSSLTIAYTGGAAQTLGAPIDDPVIEFDYLPEDTDSLKITRCYAVDININYKWKQTDTPNLLNLDQFSISAVDLVITMANGLVITLTNQVGVQFRFESMGDMENTRSIVLSHHGRVQMSAMDGIFS